MNEKEALEHLPVRDLPDFRFGDIDRALGALANLNKWNIENVGTSPGNFPLPLLSDVDNIFSLLTFISFCVYYIFFTLQGT